MTMKRDVNRFLKKIGVETRFISIVDERIYINNLKLSRFSRKKEELFLENFPDYEVRRSKVFQRICTRASRVLKNALNPGDKVLLAGPDNCVNLTLYMVLEPYTRKYGVELIIFDPENVDEENGRNKGTRDLQLHGIVADSMALPLTLDGEVEHILEQMLQGDKLELLSSQNQSNGMKLIYPLINVPRSWIQEWIEIEGLSCVFEESGGLPREMLEFMEGFIPDVREKMMSSAGYLNKD